MDQGHLSAQVPKSLEFCMFNIDDPVLFVSPSSSHCILMHYETDQIATAVAVGASPPIAQGPSPYRPFTPMPQSMHDLFHDDKRFQWNDTEQWVTTTYHEAKRAKNNMRFHASRLPGGWEGYEYGVDDIRPPYGADAFVVPITDAFVFRPSHAAAIPAPFGVASMRTHTNLEKASTIMTRNLRTSGMVTFFLPDLGMYVTISFKSLAGSCIASNCTYISGQEQRTTATGLCSGSAAPVVR